MNNSMVGKCICLSDNLFRILFVDSENTYLVRLNSKKTDVIVVSTRDVETVIKFQQAIEQKPHKVLDVNLLSDEEQRRFSTAKAIVNEIVEIFGPTFIQLVSKKKTGIISTLSLKYGVSVKTIWKYIRYYLQSGLDDCALIDGRLFNDIPSESKKCSRLGRKNKDSETSTIIFDETVQRNADKIIGVFKKSREMTIKGAYQMFINTFYSVYDPETNRYIWFPKNQIPTYRQFSYYLNKKLPKQKRDEIRSSKIEVENNKRILTGSSRTNVTRPGMVVECDACEIDLSLVSHLNPEQTVGRPIMYLMIDVLTSCILAISLSFENNSYIGLTNMFLNLCDDKVELCKKYGIDIEPSIWPSNIIPNELRCDRGSDFMSEDFKKACVSLGITSNYETPGIGSKKGIVEQAFHQFHAFMRTNLANYGLITKRHDSKHHQQAMLTLSDFTKLALNYVVYHNTHIIEDYKMSPEMLKDPNFTPKPYLLWRHYAAKRGWPARINNLNRNNYLYSLLREETAKISKRGVEFRKLLYINDNENLLRQMYSAGYKSINFKIKYDPRNTSRIYYLDNHQVIELKLNQNIPNNCEFKDMTWKEYEEYYERINELKRKAKDYNMELSAQHRTTNDSIIEGALTQTLPSTKNMKESRKTEKYYYNKTNPIQFNFTEETDKEKDVDVEEVEMKKASCSMTQQSPMRDFNCEDFLDFFVKHQ